MIAFVIVSLLSLVAGMAARRYRLVHEGVSRAVHFHTVSWVWSSLALLSVWRMTVTGEALWLLLIVPVMGAVPMVLVLLVGRWVGLRRDALAVTAISAGVANTGATLGAYLAKMRIEPAGEALGYAIVYVTIMAIAGILMLYPLAAHFAAGSGGQGGRPSLGRLLVKSFWCLPALSMYATLAGAALSLGDVPFPAALEQGHVIDALFYAAAVGGYFGIGLRLRFDPPWRDAGAHGLLALARFAIAPLCAVGLLMLIPDLPGVMGRVVVLESFMPAAIFSVMTANIFHLNARLAASLWLWNTLAFFLLVLPWL